MPSKRQGSIHLFQIAGIDVFLHWSWFLIAAIEIGYLRDRYTSLVWSALEYLALFLIVLLHEFGHALACRQVGGKADQIMLWPLGGVAYVDPPQRPGATLWSLAAGPLVNVALLPLLGGAYFTAHSLGWAQTMPNALSWLGWVLVIDLSLLLFNLLPIYPLDGGQILRSLLWFFLGRARSLQVATVVGFIGGACFVLYGLFRQSVWLLAVSAYMLMNCWNGWKASRALIRIEKMPRREGFACPACRSKPPLGERWRCAQCNQPFDTFATRAVCPHCGAQFPITTCLDCQESRPMSEWASAGAYTGATAPNSSPVVPQ
jgi:Zn-dependent protease